jgi:hypothetical protein
MRLTGLCALLFLAITAAPIRPSPARPAARSGPSDSAAVRAVLDRYLHGLKFNDTTSLHEAFRPDARLFFVGKDGTLGELTQAAWYAALAPSLGHEEQGDLRVTALDITRDAAAAKIVEDYPRSRYTDYVNLLRVNGRWWIVNKIFTAERRSS